MSFVTGVSFVTAVSSVTGGHHLSLAYVSFVTGVSFVTAVSSFTGGHHVSLVCVISGRWHCWWSGDYDDLPNRVRQDTAAVR